MSVVTFSEARNNFKSICDSAVDDCEPVHIHRRGGEDVVLLSASEFNAWKETMYLMANPNNSKRLLESIAQAEHGEVLNKELLD
ncbi:type II toxin-antitoxin system Phd/YefM family antitoxin [Moritella yayanosii]|uniref:Antitoxin n=1 Tax=Moritella yayanosii TaxID=69539 RepID=A0A330LVQ2_9GAMM|nr:type II toxin-antitoxin system prevent-host-death family antitoxin [Moritella yayanosii]SQD80302.1 putative antitoxin of the YoeB-YefM toxin-antitoxin system YefM [Moritella yayanosii]